MAINFRSACFSDKLAYRKWVASCGFRLFFDWARFGWRWASVFESPILWEPTKTDIEGTGAKVIMLIFGGDLLLFERGLLFMTWMPSQRESVLLQRRDQFSSKVDRDVTTTSTWRVPRKAMHPFPGLYIPSLSFDKEKTFDLIALHPVRRSIGSPE